MRTVVVIAEHELPVRPAEAYELFGSGAGVGWLLDAECDSVRPGSVVALQIPREFTRSLSEVIVLGRVARCVPGRIIEVVHDQPWHGKLTLRFRPSPVGTRLTVAAELDEHGLAWLMDRRGWARPPKLDDSVHRIGLLTSKSGPGAVFAIACENLARLAVEEINADGGLAGKQVELFVLDDATDPDRAYLETVRMINHDCRLIVASVTSASFDSAQRAVAGADAVLLYPLLNEGGPVGEHVVRWGERPHDQVAAVARRMMRGTNSKRWYFVGNDYSWSRGAHRAAVRAIEEAGGQVIGADLAPLGTTDFSDVITGIRRSDTALVMSSLVGADEVAFERQSWESGLRHDCDVLSLAMEESTRERVGDEASAGIWTAFGYFQSFDSEQNSSLRRRYDEAFGRWAPPISSLSESVYEAMLLYASAYRASRDRDTADIVARLRTVQAETPRGHVVGRGRSGLDQSLRVARAVPGGFRLQE